MSQIHCIIVSDRIAPALIITSRNALTVNLLPMVYRELCLASAREITVYTQFLWLRGAFSEVGAQNLSKKKEKRSDLIFRRINYLVTTMMSINQLWKVCGTCPLPPFGACFGRNMYVHRQILASLFWWKMPNYGGPIPTSRNEHIKSSQVRLWVGKWVLRRLVPARNLFSPPPLIHITT
jgi:hypothetical protein